jgi:hypothetical protein
MIFYVFLAHSHEEKARLTEKQERRAAVAAEAGAWRARAKRTPTSAFDPAAGKDIYKEKSSRVVDGLLGSDGGAHQVAPRA